MQKEKISKREKFLIILSLVIYLTFIVVLAILTTSELLTVFIGTTPLLLYLISFFFVYTHEQTNRWAIWVLPLIFPLGFFLLWRGNVHPILTQMEGATVAILNFLTCYLVNIFFLIIFGHKKGPNHRDSELQRLKDKLAKYEDELRITKKNVLVNLRSIEDKCKAINFVVGRVYSDKKGGSKILREELRINKELYNTFSEITANPKEEDMQQLKEVLDKILFQLHVMEENEHKGIKLGKAKTPVERAKEDSILDVMVKNDKDPIKDYHAQAKEICTKLIEFLDQESI